MLTVGLLVCAMMALATAQDPTPGPEDPTPGPDENTPGPQVDCTPAPPAPTCPDGWEEHDGRCFKYVPRGLSWADAEENCMSMKGHLASSRHVSDDEFLLQLIRKATQNNPDTWIGASDCQQNGSWFWSDGSVFLFSFWCKDKPDGLGSCLQMNHGGNTCWSDADCSLSLPSVCAKNV